MIKLANFAKNNISVSWKTILTGRKLHLADKSFVKDFASQYLLDHYKLDNINIIELAYGLEDEFEINENIKKILNALKVNIDDLEQFNIEKRKWRFLMLEKLIHQNYSNKEILEKIESIYCDFEHPEDISEFILYMPPAKDDDYDYKNHTAEKNLAHLVNRFKKFLVQEQKIVSN